MLILNIHLGLFLLSAGIGKSLCFAAAPVLFYIGIGVRNYLSVLLSLLASVPIIGMTDFSRYSVAGAIVGGPIIGGIGGLLMARSVIGFRRMLLKLEEGSDRFKKWYSNRWVRILDRLLIGKRTKDAKALFAAKTKIIRKAGFAVAVLVLAVSVIAVMLIKDSVAKDYAAAAMTRANGAEVNLYRLDLSVLTGAVSASGIQVTDAKVPQNNQVAIEKIAADASLYNLLLGKLAEPGKIVETDIEKEPSVFDPCDFRLETADISKLEKYFKDAKVLKEWLQKVRKWLPKAKEKAGTRPQEVPQKYLDYLRARASVPPSPRMLAKKILLDNVQIPSSLFGNSKVLLTNISDSARMAGLPVTLGMKSHDTGTFVNVTFDYCSEDQAPKVSGVFEGFDLGKVQSSPSRDSGLMSEIGSASGQFNGRATDESIDLPISVAVRDIKAKAKEDGIFRIRFQNNFRSP